jgi:hypothetical protein
MKDLDKLHVLADAELKFLKSIVEPLWINLNNFTNNQIS